MANWNEKDIRLSKSIMAGTKSCDNINLHTIFSGWVNKRIQEIEEFIFQPGIQDIPKTNRSIWDTVDEVTEEREHWIEFEKWCANVRGVIL